jgi:hypothetical protein
VTTRFNHLSDPISFNTSNVIENGIFIPERSRNLSFPSAASRLKERAVQLMRAHDPDFGPTLAAEMLAKRHEPKISRERLGGRMTEAGLWLSRKQRRSFDQDGLTAKPWELV